MRKGRKEGREGGREEGRKHSLPAINMNLLKNLLQGFPGGAVVKNPPANVGDMGSSPSPGRPHMPRSN